MSKLFKNKIKFTKYSFLIFIILFLSIGYAFLSVTLGLNGHIGYKASSFDVHFENIVYQHSDLEALPPTISNDNQTITFSLQFSAPGDRYEFFIDVVNDGTIDAMVGEILKEGINDSNKDYINYTVSYYNGSDISKNDLLKSKKKVKLKIAVEYNYDISELVLLSDQEFSLTIKYLRATDEANPTLNELDNYNTKSVKFIKNAKENSLVDLKIYGNTEEEKYVGKNLYNFKDTTNTSCVSEVSDDGWITISGSSTTSTVYCNYVTHNLDVKPNTLYSIITEVKDVNGNGSLYETTSNNDTEGQFQVSFHNMTELSNDTIYVDKVMTRAEFSDDKGLRSYVRFNAGQSGTITFRLSVYQDTNITKDDFKYEPYHEEINSPTPEYPQKVKSVTGDLEIDINGKNLYNANSIVKTNQITVDNDDWITIDYNNNSSNTAWRFIESDNLNLDLNKTYTVVMEVKEATGTGSIRLAANNKTDSGQLVDSVGYQFAQLIPGELYIFTSKVTDVHTRAGLATYTEYMAGYGGKITFRLSVIEGTDVTKDNFSYVPYSIKKHTISLNNIELNKIGNNRDYLYYDGNNWYVHKEINKKKILGDFLNTAGDNVRYSQFIKDYSYNSQIPISTHFVGAQSHETAVLFGESEKNNTIGFNTDTRYYRLYIKSDLSLESLNKWIEDNDIFLYYVLGSPQDVKVTDSDLINQLNSLLSDNLFQGDNSIYLKSNIPTDLEFDYTQL